MDVRGHVIDGTPGLRAAPLLTAPALAHARSGQRIMHETMLRGGRVRLIAEPVDAQDQRLVIIVGQSLADRARALDTSRGCC